MHRKREEAQNILNQQLDRRSIDDETPAPAPLKKAEKPQSNTADEEAARKKAAADAAAAKAKLDAERRRKAEARRKKEREEEEKRRKEEEERRRRRKKKKAKKPASRKKKAQKKKKSAPKPVDPSHPWKNHKCSDIGLPLCRFRERPKPPKWCSRKGRRCALDCYKNGRWQWTARTRCAVRGKKCRGTCCIQGWNYSKKKGKCQKRRHPFHSSKRGRRNTRSDGPTSFIEEADNEEDSENSDLDTILDDDLEADDEAETDTEHEDCHTEGLDASNGVIYGKCNAADQEADE
jgi:hypothetical protein